MINIGNLVADLFTFGIYSAYQNHKIIEERTKKYEEERTKKYEEERKKNKRFLSKSYNF